ncbi:hypothetical protein Lbir_2453 [Legionella birminghamensis]|uniref:Protein of uncharacterized function (DUF3311) n=1 Tax=Legionella birminghamensis TaxID=28083 RepID=A0A378I9D0_9GAMM|nr:DUF3311 domain-containing protein [Legionella birminghamensis]KTC68920.1 hypothetical protein Lbir_2453 [Legionella birminghamensis]STX31436.1 Protein of uncharacterised function (DUF3311) [Legionella birminghamensis]
MLPKPKKRWYWLLLIPNLAVLPLPWYNRLNPTLFGMPFFYWYQLLWIFLGAIIVAIVYWMTEDSDTESTGH